MTRTTPLLCLAGAAAMFGCGGSAPAISHHMPMEKIRHTPAAERDPVATAYEHLLTVKAELEHTRFMQDDAKRQAAIARAERDRARADVRVAELQIDRRKAGFLTKLADAASKQLTSSRKDSEAMDRKIRWLDAYGSYLDRQVDYLDAESLAAEAAFELAKAQVAVKRGVLSKEQGLQPFKAQAQQTKSRADARRRAADAARQQLTAAQKAWGGAAAPGTPAS